MQVLNKALAGEEIANFEFVLRTRQGQLLEILLNATPRQPTRAAQRWHALVAAHCDFLWMDGDSDESVVGRRRDASGRIIGVIGVGQDITERKRVEARSATLAKTLGMLIDTANAPIFGIDSAGNTWVPLLSAAIKQN